MDPAPGLGSPRMLDVGYDEETPATAIAGVPVGTVLGAEEEAITQIRQREPPRKQKFHIKGRYMLSPLRNSELPSHADDTGSYRPAARVNLD